MQHLTITTLAAALHTLGVRANTYLLAQRDALKTVRSSRLAAAPERGSVTIEQVIWAVAVIAIVGIVVAAVKSYVTTQAGNIR